MVYFNLALTPASSNCLFILDTISSASLALALAIVSRPSSTDPKVLPLTRLFTPLINLAPPSPINPAPRDIPPVLNASPNNCESVKS